MAVTMYSSFIVDTRQAHGEGGTMSIEQGSGGSDMRIDGNGAAGLDGDVRTASQPYVLESFRWPVGQTTITYSFNDSTIDLYSTGREDALGNSLSSDLRGIVREAMDAWESVCGVRFVEVADTANVRIGWQPDTPLDPNYVSDGEGGRVGITFTWYSGNVIDEQAVVFDPAENWDDVSFYDVALHELGHVLGIDHSDVYSSVLSTPPYTLYADQPGRDQLTADDIAAARALWGQPGSGPPTSRPPTPNIERYGTPGNDTIIGNAGDDTMYGFGGDDRLLGGAGNDSIVGGTGNDWLWGEGGNDALLGGDGVDILFGMNGDDGIGGGYGRDIILGGSGNDFILGDFGALDDGTSAAGYLDGNDGIWGGGGHDTIWGAGGDDFLAGGTGNDRIYGEGGQDYLAGESGNDALDGGAGYDVIVGGSGSDTLIGGPEGDTFFGQQGADRFDYNGGTVWVMDFNNMEDVLVTSNGATFTNSAQAGWHARYDLSDGGTIFLAWTNVGDVDVFNLV